MSYVKRKETMLAAILENRNAYVGAKCDWSRAVGVAESTINMMRKDVHASRIDTLVFICNTLGIECGGTLITQKLLRMAEICDLLDDHPTVRLESQLESKVRNKHTDSLSLERLERLLEELKDVIESVT